MQSVKSIPYVLYLTLFFVTFKYTIIQMAAPYIVSSLGGSNTTAIYAVAFFGLGNALTIPLGKPFMERIPLSHFFSIFLLLDFFLSIIAITTKYYFVFLIARFFLGAVSGPFYYMIYKMLSDLFKPEEKTPILSILVTILTITPVLGACWGGWLAYNYNWRWIYHFNSIIALSILFYCYPRVKNLNLSLPKTPFDWVGFISYTISIFCLCFISIMGQELDWFRSHLIVTCAILGSFFFIFFILWQCNTKNPLLDLTIFKYPTISLGLFCLAFIFATYFGVISLLSLWLNLDVNYTPLWIILMLLVMVISSFFPWFLIAEKFGPIDLRIPLSIAVICLSISCIHSSIFTDQINFGRIVFSRFIAGIGIAFFLPPIFQLCFRHTPIEKAPSVFAILQIIRSLTGSIGLSIYYTIWLRRQVFYHSRLGEDLTIFSTNTKEFFSKAKEIGLQTKQATAELGSFLNRRSTSLALDDSFYLMGWILIAMLIIFLICTLFLDQGLFKAKSKSK